MTLAQSMARPMVSSMAQALPYMTGGTPLLLDTLPVAADLAYSERRLGPTYTGAVNRVRRSSDNAEQDVSTTAIGYDSAAALAFTGANSGLVVTRYDQSGNARHATQGTAAAQMRIIDAGVLDTLNGRAATTGTANGQYWSISPALSTVTDDDFTLIGVCQTTFDSSFVGSFGTGNTQFRLNRSGALQMSFRANPIEALSDLGAATASAGVFAFARSAGVVSFYVNGVLVGSGASNPGFDIDIIGSLDGIQSIRGPFPELVYMRANLTLPQMQPALRNMGAYYGITVA